LGTASNGKGKMRISCFPRNETQLRRIVDALKDAGLFSQYEEQAHGENILLSVRTRTFEEREQVQAILQEAGVSELIYGDDRAA
jgi:hypothetical protein